jgi:hypothetical protein
MFIFSRKIVQTFQLSRQILRKSFNCYRFWEKCREHHLTIYLYANFVHICWSEQWVCCRISAETIAVNNGCELARYSCTNSQKSWLLLVNAAIKVPAQDVHNFNGCGLPVVWPMVTITVSSYKIGWMLLTAEGKSWGLDHLCVIRVHNPDRNCFVPAETRETKMALMEWCAKKVWCMWKVCYMCERCPV